MSRVQSQASFRLAPLPTAHVADASFRSRHRLRRPVARHLRDFNPSSGLAAGETRGDGVIARAAVEEAPHTIQHYSIDIESVATGRRHDARAAAHIALVDEEEHVLADLYIKPDKPIVSYITPVTGLTKEVLNEKGMRLKDAVNKLRENLPSDAVLVGQDVEHDVKELGLEQGVDFKAFVNIPQLFKIFSKKTNAWTLYPVEHVAKAVLGIRPTEKFHNAVDDALLCIKVFKFYMDNKDNQPEWMRAKKKIMMMRKPQSFATSHPLYEGVCMGNRKKCYCDAPFPST